MARPPRTRRPFVDELPRLLEKRGMTLRSVSRAAGVDHAHLSRVLRGDRGRKVSPDLARRVAEALGLPADFFPEYDASQMRKRFYAALERAGVRRVRFHDLRHTFGTRMAAAGAPLRAIQEWMGHADYQTTLVYADYAPDPSQGTAWAQRAFGSSPDSGPSGRSG